MMLLLWQFAEAMNKEVQNELAVIEEARRKLLLKVPAFLLLWRGDG